MKWKTWPFSFHLILEEGDNGYSGILKKNETNIFAIIYRHLRTRRYSDMRICGVKRPEYQLYLADLKGKLYFKKLKDAKQFAENTYNWMLGNMQVKLEKTATLDLNNEDLLNLNSTLSLVEQYIQINRDGHSEKFIVKVEKFVSVLREELDLKE